jgi:hypothetical protein
MTNTIRIVKTEGGDNVIVEREGKRPKVYESIADVIQNEFGAAEIYKQYNSSAAAFTVSVQVEINPPTIYINNKKI